MSSPTTPVISVVDDKTISIVEFKSEPLAPKYKSKANLQPIASSDKLRSTDFMLSQMQNSMTFFDPDRVCDYEQGGYFHFFDAKGNIYDKNTRVLVTQARFIFSLAVGYEHLKDKKYYHAVEHGVKYLATGPLRNEANGAYHWLLVDGKPKNSKIFTYGLAQTLLAYSAAVRIGVKDALPFLEETFNLMEEKLFISKFGLYAEEADAEWNLEPYRSESGNLHTVEALIASYEATKEWKYLQRALTVADGICNKAAGQTKGLVWEHFDEKWNADVDFANDNEALKIFRPWGFQPGHQVEWARFLLTIYQHLIDLGKEDDHFWLAPKARYLFDIATKYAWDREFGGMVYSFDLEGNWCNDDKIFWVQCESIGTAAMLASLYPQEREYYFEIFDKLWDYSWNVFMDHENGSWLRRLKRDGEPYFTEKTKLNLCVDPDFHMMGSYAGAIMMMKKYLN